MAFGVHDGDIRSGPDRYVNIAGEVRNLDEYLQQYHHPAIITGERSWQAFRRYADTFEPHYPVFHYDGSATLRNAHQLAQQVEGADVVVAIGAGKLSDTVKNVAALLHCSIVMVPTMAATCAAYSAFSVNYDEEHRYVNAPMHASNSDILIVDPQLIATSPVEYFIGGIGDTLAKWYESAPIFARCEQLSTFDRLAQQAASIVRSVIIEESKDAVSSLQTGLINEHVNNVIDAIIGLGGTVGGFGGVRARASGAHAMHDALTLLPESSPVVHGAKVAYGIIVQLLVEDKTGEARRLLPFYDSIGLPHSFADMGMTPSAEKWRTVAEAAADPSFSFCRAVPNITPQRILSAMNQAEYSLS
ncbi:iron-containing alcohol dehydrogenase family protein [Bifidobacterium aquikefiricola]|uniref:Iron-containing alcohol dehydrogenase family protein n=1 Tax=Bifidobacterium aquikefiricola TaxID=3059038 RepID=A0AB39U976_9BIFI